MERGKSKVLWGEGLWEEELWGERKMGEGRLRPVSAPIDVSVKRLVDVVASVALLLLVSPLIAVVAVAIKAESRGPVFYRCNRVGLDGREFRMLKFRKMLDGTTGSPLTLRSDERFTRIGSFLAKTKLDEVPQLWNVVKGEMSLVGPRPEDPSFVRRLPQKYSRILSVKPGMTGLSQLAFARETEILDPTNPVDDYVSRVQPQKAALDDFYSGHRSLRLDLRILAWTAVAVLLRRDVAVHRDTMKLSRRRRTDKRRLATDSSTLRDVA
jgi:lipopolysaccharide/colanic/teichoic acid biosynthesis glycosyltransferase